MVKAIKRRNPTKKMLCDHLVYEDEDGNAAHLRAGQWVVFKRKQSSRDYRRMLHFAAVAESIEGEGAMGLLESEFAALSEFLTRKIVSWNWRDLDAEELDENSELPALKNPPDVDTLDDLDFEDLMNLLDLYMEGTSNTKKV